MCVWFHIQYCGELNHFFQGNDVKFLKPKRSAIPLTSSPQSHRNTFTEAAFLIG